MIEIIEKLKKYNFWDKGVTGTGYKREFYLERIKKYLGNKLIKVITGQRRVGKSYLLRQIIEYLIRNEINPKNIFYLNKELVEFEEIRNHSDLNEVIILYKKIYEVTAKVYIFIDEIELIENWEVLVNSLSQNYIDEYEIFITGSNSLLLSGELSTLLSGRYISFEVYPFLYEEWYDYQQLENNKDVFLKFLYSGGLPELFNLREEETKQHYVSSLKDTILLKDVVRRYKIKDYKMLENIFNFITNNVGNIFSINSLSNYYKGKNIKTNYETISAYVSYLINSYLIHDAVRYDIKGKEILSGLKKFYLNDLSFRNYLFSGFDYTPGKLLENYVFIYCKSHGYNVYTGKLRDKEIDFILEKDKERKYLQVAYSLSDEKVVEREFGNLESIPDHFEKLVITTDERSFGNRNGIKHVPVFQLSKILK